VLCALQYKSKTLDPRWLEQFDLYMYDDQSNQLEITVFDHDVSGRDDFMGRYVRTFTLSLIPAGASISLNSWSNFLP